MQRDLLVLQAKHLISQEEIDRQIAILNIVLAPVENWLSFCVANEIIDINRRKIISKEHLVQKLLKDNPNKPFVFICNKN
jgi:predicted metal-dependent phosphotriesterase family hydrolase